MNENFKYFSEMEKCEIINICDGEKYNYLSNNDVLIDEEGYFKVLILSKNKGKFLSWTNNEFMEVPWDCVKKIAAKTIIIDFEDNNMKKIESRFGGKFK